MNARRTDKPRMRPATRLFGLLLLGSLVLTLVPMALANAPRVMTVSDFVGAEGAAGLEGPENSLGAAIDAPAAPDDVLLLQPPNQANAILSDAGCDSCPSGAESIAEDFTLGTDEIITSISIWGIYVTTDTPMPDDWTVIFHADTGARPGAALNTQSSVPSSFIVTGNVLGYTELQYTLALPTPVPLSAGTYWVEIYTDTGFGSDDWAWETGIVDPVSGRPGIWYAFEAPGVVWGPDPRFDMAIQVGNTPTAVELASFSAAMQGNAVLLEWETATELDNLGFNVYRSGTVQGERVQLNGALIPVRNPGTPLGATYRFLDETASPGIMYYYWLEDVDVYGMATIHGPVSGQALALQRLLPARPRYAPAMPLLQSQ